jgi:hypothetical protein
MIWLKRIGSVVGGIAVVVGLIIAVNTYEAKFATAEDIQAIRADIQLIGKRLENKINTDRVHTLQARIWTLEDRYGGPGVPNASLAEKEHYRELKSDLQLLMVKLRE